MEAKGAGGGTGRMCMNERLAGQAFGVEGFLARQAAGLNCALDETGVWRGGFGGRGGTEWIAGDCGSCCTSGERVWGTRQL